MTNPARRVRLRCMADILNEKGWTLGMNDNIPEGEEFLRQHGFYPTKTASAVVRSTTDSAESDYGPFFARETRPCFHRPTCKYIRRFLKWRDTTRFVSHRAAVDA